MSASSLPLDKRSDLPIIWINNDADSVARKIAINETSIKYLDGSESKYSKTVSQSDKDFIEENASEILASILEINYQSAKNLVSRTLIKLREIYFNL